MRQLHVAALLALAALCAHAEVLWSRRLSSCLGSGPLVAPEDQQLVFTDLYAQFDQGQKEPGQYHAAGIDLDLVPSPIFNQDGAVLTGTGDLLRVVLVGNTVAVSEGFSDGTGDDAGLLSTLIVDSQVLSFDVASNKTALCSAIRTDEGDTGVTSNGTESINDSGCPYSGAVALGFTVPLASSYPLTTITTNLLALDPSSPALHLACYDLSFTPYYPDYFAYRLIHYRKSLFSLSLSPCTRSRLTLINPLPQLSSVLLRHTSSSTSSRGCTRPTRRACEIPRPSSPRP